MMEKNFKKQYLKVWLIYCAGVCLDDITAQVSPGWIEPMAKIELGTNPCVSAG